jgi:hypothetical protein
MITITNEKWIADLGAMMCRNIENRIVAGFERKGKTLEGTLRDKPVELLESWAALADGERKIQRAVEQAEEVFMGMAGDANGNMGIMPTHITYFLLVLKMLL